MAQPVGEKRQMKKCLLPLANEKCENVLGIKFYQNSNFVTAHVGAPKNIPSEQV